MFWQVANLETYGCLTVHRMDATFDTGPIVDVVKIPLALHDTRNLFLQKLALAARERLPAIVDRLPSMEFKAQAPEEAVYRSRPQPQDLVVDWSEHSASQIDALIRACNHEYGGAVTGFRGAILRLFEARTGLENSDAAKPPGTILSADSNLGLSVQCSGNTILHLEIVHTESGYFSGARLADALGIQPGELMAMPEYRATDTRT